MEEVLEGEISEGKGMTEDEVAEASVKKGREVVWETEEGMETGDWGLGSEVEGQGLVAGDQAEVLASEVVEAKGLD